MDGAAVASASRKAKRADLNLMGLFADNHGSLYATAEHGQVLRSDDQEELALPGYRL